MRTSLALLAASSAAVFAAPTSPVVFGNLGSTGDGNLSATNTDIGTDYDGIAVGFYTPFTTYYVESITVGVFFDNLLTDSFTLGIYNGLNWLVATSSATQVGAGGKYTFLFNNFELNQNAWYTIQPSTGLSWYAAAGFALPTEQNGSGIGYESTSYLPTGTSEWTAAPFAYSLSINASTAPIPEPSTYGMILGGLALAGAALRRRRKA
jgi:hypothetical protein